MVKKKGIVIGTLVGSAIGAVTALLLAPKPGKELRKDISVKSNELYEKGSDILIDAKNKGVELKDVVVEKSKDLKGKMKNDSVVKPTSGKDNSIVALEMEL